MKVTYVGGPLDGRSVEFEDQDSVPDYVDDWGQERDTADGHWEWFWLETANRTGYKFMDLTFPDHEHGQFRHASRHASRMYRKKGKSLKVTSAPAVCPEADRERMVGMASEQRERLAGVA